MKKLILLASLLAMGTPVLAHNRHNHHTHNDRHNHCHYHKNRGYGHCHRHRHGGQGNGHHGTRYIDPIYHPGLNLWFNF